MRRITVRVAALAIVLMAVPVGTAGQAGETEAAEWRPGVGDRSVAFSVPEAGSGTIALWWHRTRGRAFGLEFAASGEVSLLTGGADTDRLGSQADLSFGPAFKWYRGSLGPVAPYFLAGFGVLGSFGYAADRDPAVDPVSQWGVGGYVRVAGGVDWFIAERVSLGGHVGGRVHYRFGTGAEPPDPDRHDLDLGTFTSGLTLHLYF